MLFCGDWLVPVGSPPVADGAILAADGEIVEVGPAAELRARHPDEEVLECPGCALLPGFVNAHTHLDYSAFKGFPRPRGFFRWIIRLTRARMKLDANDLAASALWGAHECLRNGVTSIADTSYGGGTVARAVRATGLRARVYLEVFGLDDRRLAATMGRVKDALDDGGGDGGDERLEWGISPHAPYTVSQGLYREVARFARGRGLRMATHVAESRTEVRLLARGSGLAALVYKVAGLVYGGRWRLPRVRPLQYVAGTGALGQDMLVIHAVQLDSGDMETLAESGAVVAHCPRSNLELECGVAPVSEMRAAGITVGLGTDSLASNDSLDMLAEMRTALRVSGSLLPSEVLRMATFDGACALGWGRQTGSLEVGKRADVAAVCLPKGMPGNLPAEELVRAVMDGEVRLTVVDGRVVHSSEPIPLEVTRGLAKVRAKLGLGD